MESRAGRIAGAALIAVATVEADHRNAAFGAEPFLDGHKLCHALLLPPFYKCPVRSRAGRLSGGGKRIVVPIVIQLAFSPVMLWP